MGFFLETLIGGLMTGMLYSLVALGFVLIFWNGARLALDPLLTLGCVGTLFCVAQPAASEREARRVRLFLRQTGNDELCKVWLTRLHAFFRLMARPDE